MKEFKFFSKPTIKQSFLPVILLTRVTLPKEWAIVIMRLSLTNTTNNISAQIVNLVDLRVRTTSSYSQCFIFILPPPTKKRVTSPSHIYHWHVFSANIHVAPIKSRWRKRAASGKSLWPHLYSKSLLMFQIILGGSHKVKELLIANLHALLSLKCLSHNYCTWSCLYESAFSNYRSDKCYC